MVDIAKCESEQKPEPKPGSKSDLKPDSKSSVDAQALQSTGPLTFGERCKVFAISSGFLLLFMGLGVIYLTFFVPEIPRMWRNADFSINPAGWVIVEKLGYRTEIVRDATTWDMIRHRWGPVAMVVVGALLYLGALCASIYAMILAALGRRTWFANYILQELAKPSFRVTSGE